MTVLCTAQLVCPDVCAGSDYLDSFKMALFELLSENHTAYKAVMAIEMTQSDYCGDITLLSQLIEFYCPATLSS